MICIKCNQFIPDLSKFCNHCGAPQKPPERPHKARGNGQGSVYKRGNKWAVEVTLGYYMDGDRKKRKIRRKCGFDRKKDALAYIETLRASEPVKVATFSSLYAEYQKSQMPKLSHSKQQAYEIAWKKIAYSISLAPIRSASVPQLQQITDDAGSSYYTKRDIKNLLSNLYKIAIRDDYTDRNKAQYIELPPLESSERTIFTEDEIAALWLDQDQYVVQHILVMLYTGMRPAEMLQLQTANVHLSEHFMTGGVKTKKSKARKIIIPDKVSETLEQLICGADCQRVSNYTKHKFYDEWAAYKALRGLREELSPYCCRHTYITRLTALKVSPAMLQELAGHEDYETTLEYTHLSVQDRLNEVNKLK
jgi:integrase